MKSKKLALCALFTALALTLSYAESWLPLTLLIPVPGLKLGLANIVTLAALYLFGFPFAAVVTFARCFLGAFYASGPTSFWFSICGAAFSLALMSGLKALFPRSISLWGISIAGAAAHHIGQMCAAAVLMRTTTIFSYLPILLLASPFTGAITAAVSLPVISLCAKLRDKPSI